MLWMLWYCSLQYLGTELVKKFEGPKTTEEACHKMQVSTRLYAKKGLVAASRATIFIIYGFALFTRMRWEILE